MNERGGKFQLGRTSTNTHTHTQKRSPSKIVNIGTQILPVERRRRARNTPVGVADVPELGVKHVQVLLPVARARQPILDVREVSTRYMKSPKQKHNTFRSHGKRFALTSWRP